MGLKDTASLALIPAAYKTSKIYSALPTDGDGDFTFTRTGNATRINKAGLVETMGTNIGRLNYDLTNGTPASCPSLLLEPSRANIKTHSEAVNNWTQSNISTSTNQTTAPDGSTNADKIIENSGGGSHKVYSSVSTTSGQAYTWSVFLKSDTRSKVRLNIFGAFAEFDVTNQTLLTQSGITSYKIEDYGGGWGRFSITKTANASSTLTYVYLLNDSGSVSYTGDGSSGLFVWGGQMELGSYPTSYIPTTTGAVTRTLDNAHLLSQTLFTNYPFTVYAKASLDAIGNTIFSLNNTSSQNYYLAFYFPNSTQAGILRRDLSTNDSDFYSFSGSVGTTYKIAVAFVSATAYKLYIDGTQIANITSGGSIPFNHNDISLGQFRITGDTTTRNGIDEFMVFNEALSDSELQTLTS